MGRGLGTNAHVTTPGGLGFGCGPLGGGFSPALGGATHMTWRNLIGQEHYPFEIGFFPRLTIPL
ncbi:hypothetical protein HanXRQr2_Chr05g0199511 [Helianthus annuus]|uniref:Uncharacterized protein n=1 Tax=Helianthus annuus TaxID=4232 RepID=A0A9K3IXV6_HELAN|nr:hypothetical protein HanXRQr2_Chr05g0199511 [Helianthus annuus]